MSALVEHQISLPGDRACIVRLERAVRGDVSLADVLVDIDLQSFVEATISHYTAAALLHAGEVFLLKAEDQVIGACVCVRSSEPADEALLLSMGILPGWRGQGLGQRFVGWVLGALASEGYGSVSLLVGSDNTRALRIYREVGFDVVREGYADPMTAERQLLLRVRLASLHPPGLSD